MVTIKSNRITTREKPNSNLPVPSTVVEVQLLHALVQHDVQMPHNPSVSFA